MKTTYAALVWIIIILALFLVIRGLGIINFESTVEISPDSEEPVYMMMRDGAPLENIIDELNRNPQLINNFKWKGKSLLYYTLSFDREDAAKKIIEMGANPNTNPEVLFISVSEKKYEIVKYLLEHGANPLLEIYPGGKSLPGVFIYDLIKDDYGSRIEDEEMKEMVRKAVIKHSPGTQPVPVN